MKNRLSVIIPIFACLAFGLFFFSPKQEAQITLPIIVGTTSDVVVFGACLPTTQGGNPANCSLRGAIEQANVGSSNSVIRVQIPGCPPGVCIITLTQALPDIIFPLSIVGPGADKLTVQRGNGTPAFRIFNVTSTGTVSISGMTISNAFSNGNGGGIKNLTATLNVTNCVISGNLANNGYGGGIYNQGGTLNVSNSTITSNNAVETTGGGGIFSGDGGTLNLINSTVSHNYAATGGGVYSGSGSSTSSANITNSTFYENDADLKGGGIFNNENAVLQVTNSTLSHNNAGSGFGVNGGGISSMGAAYVENTIIAMNLASVGLDVSGNFFSMGFNLVGIRDGSGGFPMPTDLTGTLAAPLNPMLDSGGLRNNGGPTKTVALRIGSPAIDKGQSFGLTGDLTTDQRGGASRRTFDNAAVSNSAGGDGTDIGAFELQSRFPADFDGDEKTDIGIFRPSAGEWWINMSSSSGTLALQFGQPTDRIAPGDFTGDGKADIAFWRPSNGFWFILRSHNFTFFAFPFGTNGDIPAPADFDAGGVIDEAVFRPSTGTWFYVRSFDETVIIAQFGASGDVPVPGDYDGDGAADLAIFRPSVGQWWLNRSTAGVIAFTFGNPLDKPVQCDYTADGKTDVAFWRPSTGEWFIIRSEDASFFAFPFGANGDLPAPGDYDGDGKCDAAVFRPSSATWFIARSTAGTQIVPFGATGDRPVANAYVP